MDVFCDRCDAADGVTPDDHPCLRNLKTKFNSALVSIREKAGVPPGTPVDFTQPRWGMETLQVVQNELLQIYVDMAAVEDWHLAEASEQSRRANLVGKEVGEVHKWVNASRGALRNLLDDVD